MGKDKILYKMCNFIATFFYIGYVPKCPGTVSSLIAIVLFFFLPPLSLVVSILIAMAIFFLGVFVSTNVSFNCKLHDPSKVVIDEVLGVWVSIIVLPKVLWMYVFAFILFRFFDISKIFFINRLEQISGGWGIMLDDLFAGLFTLGIIGIIRLFVGI